MRDWSDAQIDNYYRNRWIDSYGYDPLDPDGEDHTDGEYTDENGCTIIIYDEPDYIKPSERY